MFDVSRHFDYRSPARKARRLSLLLAALLAGSLAPGSGRATPQLPPSADEARGLYAWQRRALGYESLASRLPVPAGFRRVAVKPGSYESWLRHLPLLESGTPVRSYRGRMILPASSPAMAAVVDLDVGSRDRQHCADTIMRLRGEYLFVRGKADEVRFFWAGGRRFGYREWRHGLRPKRHGRGWAFEPAAAPAAAASRTSFRRYLEHMFSWTGTMHQIGEPRVEPSDLRAGDFFVQGGSPGHAVVILDVARDADGHTVALLGQGFMPAQDLHVLRAASGSPWFTIDPPRTLVTPLWQRPFSFGELRRFRY